MKRPGRKFEVAKNRRRLRKARTIPSRYYAEGERKGRRIGRPALGINNYEDGWEIHQNE